MSAFLARVLGDISVSVLSADSLDTFVVTLSLETRNRVQVGGLISNKDAFKNKNPIYKCLQLYTRHSVIQD